MRSVVVVMSLFWLGLGLGLGLGVDFVWGLVVVYLGQTLSTELATSFLSKWSSGRTYAVEVMAVPVPDRLVMKIHVVLVFDRTDTETVMSNLDGRFLQPVSLNNASQPSPLKLGEYAPETRFDSKKFGGVNQSA
ncbi:hypothetical protein BO70DRAFT_348591 [Aspergillus heteromorphus CBS 117.55]|uniref:Uncharacterized protein n=1 Tax=Aspergillus heteromorphus CBS 117.55 TaxID=1448321 RepID=A0A317X210_9EURO|nr:uncharacterized protein BO70DRAFT_348591 [Aspergillus heteromorphus CBS 117.55]PWY92171.1 hypothetical protein BO70DRAFT_348591 [Aspergillus heteromorphus CBS 117.55]